MRICIVAPEIFAWGSYGGYGKFARLLGSTLVKRGHEVYVVTPRKPGQRSIEQLDGMVILSFAESIRGRLDAIRIFKDCEADIYHLWGDPYFTFYYLAVRFTSKAKHLVVFHDPWEDMKKLAIAEKQGLLKSLYTTYVASYIAKRTVHKAEALFCAAKFLAPIVKRQYNLANEPGVLGYPVEIPPYLPKKATDPTVCFSARWDPVKRIEHFLDLARYFPDVQFIAMGKARDPGYERYLREKYADVSNLEFTGFVDEAKKDEILERSWVLVNTSFHEGLPGALLEALARGCALLSAVDPDNIVSNFGYYVRDDDFKTGLAQLLKDNRWKSKGETGAIYVKQNYELSKVTEQHLEIYETLLRER